jgi:hypothetical protein
MELVVRVVGKPYLGITSRVPVIALRSIANVASLGADPIL